MILPWRPDGTPSEDVIEDGTRHIPATAPRSLVPSTPDRPCHPGRKRPRGPSWTCFSSVFIRVHPSRFQADQTYQRDHHTDRLNAALFPGIVCELLVAHENGWLWYEFVVVSLRRSDSRQCHLTLSFFPHVQ